jgi:hypothetical protein
VISQVGRSSHRDIATLANNFKAVLLPVPLPQDLSRKVMKRDQIFWSVLNHEPRQEQPAECMAGQQMPWGKRRVNDMQVKLGRDAGGE